MKDIYSPLEIDEEWDERAPMADGSATAVLVKPQDDSVSTLPPDDSTDQPTPVMADSALPPLNGTLPPSMLPATQAEDIDSNAYDVSSMDTTMGQDDTFNIKEAGMAMGMPSEDKPEATAEVPAMTDLNTDLGDSSSTNTAEPGEMFKPSITPSAGIREDQIIDNSKKSEPEAPVELALSPVASTNSDSKSDPEPKHKPLPVFSMKEDKPSKESDSSDEDQGPTGKRFSAEVERLNDAKQRAVDNLNKLKDEVQEQIDDMNSKISTMQESVVKKETELSNIGAKLDEVGPVK
jgi:uncharacterized protein YukE